VGAYKSSDPDTERIWWHEAGVNQNLSFPVQPDPASGMHCWHHELRVEPAHADDLYGDIYVDTTRSREVYEEWLLLTKPASGPGGLLRPPWFNRTMRPAAEAYRTPAAGRRDRSTLIPRPRARLFEEVTALPPF